jgi:urease accessory protein
MDVYDTYEGTVEAGSPDSDDLETVTVGSDQRRRSRFRTATETGREVGVVVGRELRAGDVLSTAGDGPRLAVALEPVEAVVVDLTDAAADPTATVALGHAAGNRHWEMAVRDGAVLFPAAESEARMDATLAPHLPEDATVSREQVSPALFDGDVGSGSHSHTHDGEGSDGHSHGHTHGVDDARGHDHGHHGGDGS